MTTALFLRGIYGIIDRSLIQYSCLTVLAAVFHEYGVVQRKDFAHKKTL